MEIQSKQTTFRCTAASVLLGFLGPLWCSDTTPLLAAVEGFVVSEGVEGGNSLYRINLDTGATERVGSLRTQSGTSYVSFFGGLGFDGDGRLLGSSFISYDPATGAPLGAWELVEINTDTGIVSPIGALLAPPDESVQSIEFIPNDNDYAQGELMAAYARTGGLGQVNEQSGDYTSFGGTQAPFTVTAMAYNKIDRKLYGFNQGGDFFYFQPGTGNPLPMNGVPVFSDGHSMRFAFPGGNGPNDFTFVGTAGAAFDPTSELIYAVAHIEGPSDPDPNPSPDDPLLITNNLDSLLFTIDVSGFDGTSSESIKTNIIGDTGLSWLGGLAIRAAPRVGDFNGDGILDLSDIDLLLKHVAEVANPTDFDLTNDDLVDGADVDRWVKELKGTWLGDANLDGEFASSDIVQVFQGGKFETDLTAGWSEGDWSGDLRFGTRDFVIALQDGGFEAGPRRAEVVPEPTSGLLVLAVLLAFPTGRASRLNSVLDVSREMKCVS